MVRTLIRNGRMALETGLEVGDVLLEDGRIQAVGRLDPGIQADEILDASGLYVLPGLIDLHTHLDDRIGSVELADSYESGTRVAALNGITTLLCFVTESVEVPLVQAVEHAAAKARGRIHTDLAWHLTPIRFDEASWRDIDALMERGFRTFKFYTTYREAGLHCTYERLDEVFGRLAAKGVQFLVHAEDDERLARVDPGALDLSLPATHALLRPEEAELEAASRVLAIAQKHDAKLHLVHVSALETAQLMADQCLDLPFTCETCPQYLWLDDNWLARPDGHRWICSPPLRSRREAFRQAVRTGAVDVFATDHCAFRRADKDAWNGLDVRRVPNGLPGLGSLVPLVWKLFEGDSDQAALALARRLSAGPARIAGLADRKGALRPGLDADVVILDPSGPVRALRSTLSDVYEPYQGFTTTLTVRHVFLRGSPLVRDGALAGEPAGRLLCDA